MVLEKSVVKMHNCCKQNLKLFQRSQIICSDGLIYCWCYFFFLSDSKEVCHVVACWTYVAKYLLAFVLFYSKISELFFSLNINIFEITCFFCCIRNSYFFWFGNIFFQLSNLRESNLREIYQYVAYHTFCCNVLQCSNVLNQFGLKSLVFVVNLSVKTRSIKKTT